MLPSELVTYFKITKVEFSTERVLFHYLAEILSEYRVSNKMLLLILCDAVRFFCDATRFFYDALHFFCDALRHQLLRVSPFTGEPTLEQIRNKYPLLKDRLFILTNGSTQFFRL